MSDFTVTAPAGAWTDLVIDLDGPITLQAETASGAPVSLVLAVDRLVIPLEDPDQTGPLVLDWALPTWPSGWAAWGRQIGPGDAEHDALAQALAAGVVAVAR